MSVTVVTAAQPIVDVATARAQLGIPAVVVDAVVAAWISAATQAIDGPTGWLNRAVGQQTLKLTLPGFSWDCRDPVSGYSISLPYPEIIGVDAVSYLDQDGAAQTIAASSYTLADRSLIPVLGVAWPASRAGFLQITYKAGYATVPETIKQAVLLSVSQMRSMQSRDPMLTVDTVYGVGSQQFSAGSGAGLASAVQAMLEPFRVIL